MICDLAETYHILNYEGLPPDLVATLVLGLKNDSRVKMKISDAPLTIEQTLLAMMTDNLNFIAWTKTRDAQKHGKYNQKSVLKSLRGEYQQEKKDDLLSFTSSEELQEYFKKFENIGD